jgi:DNA (cytosine-5)-methyltransferase 1
MKVLDLFCCAGGAAFGLKQAWPEAEITGVDIDPQPRYPFKFVRADAVEFDVSGFDFIWASPPCQGYSALKTMTNSRVHPKLIEEVRYKLQMSGCDWVIENVPGAPMQNSVMLCGSHFELESEGFQLRRHRLFESNFPIAFPGECKHWERTVGVYGAKVRDIAQEKRHYSQPKEGRGKPVGVVLKQSIGRESMGIDWMNMHELSEAIPPAYSRYIGEQWLVKEGR